MSKNSKKSNIKNKNKHKFNKSEIKEKILKNVFFTVIGYISSIITIVTLICNVFFKLDDSVALENYEKGIIYFEDYNLMDAESCFMKAYKINKDLLDIKYYYAYTEFLLDKKDESYMILKENRNSLNEDEIAFYARYESDNKNYEKAKKYLNMIQEPEKLKNPALAQYVITSLNLSCLEDYDELCNTVYLNTILLNQMININQNLISNSKIYFPDNVKIDFKELEDLQERVIHNAEYDVIMLKMYKLYMYTLFTSYAIQYDDPEIPIYVFVEASESIDYINYSEISTCFLEILGFYTIELQLDQNYHEEIKTAYNNAVKKYDELLKLGYVPEKETEEAFEVIKMMSCELNDNTFDPNEYEYVYPGGNTYEDIDSDELLKLWNYEVQEKYR